MIRGTTTIVISNLISILGNVKNMVLSDIKRY